MKRRDFLSTPLAMAALGTGAFVPGLVRAAATKTGTAGTMLLMRLDGSTGKPSDEQLLDNAWQTSWATSSKEGALKTARLSLYGLVRSHASTLGQLNIDAQYLAANNAINTVSVYTGATTALGDRSKGVSMDVSSASFIGFALSAATTASKGASTLGTCAIGNGQPIAPGVYALLLPTAAQRAAPADYLFSTYLDRPLMRRNGALPEIDYVAFSIAASR